MMIRSWIRQILSTQTFEQHFLLDHEFHGIKHHYIHETFTIRPKTDLGLQMLLDGVQINNQKLHLKSKITIQSECITIFLQVSDPSDSQSPLLLAAI
jgi:hypothetical protein